MLEQSATVMARAVNAREISARELIEETLRHVDARDHHVGAYLTRLDDRALQAAAEVDKRVADGVPLPLAGVPLAVKDNMCLSATRTTAGSKILGDWVAPYTATAVQRMID
ncbi:MAG: Asp-tRNA(Asn)/Glu-tRNA(Gln) amidotransferase GatCAB subunit A, partial [Candidatus Eremiobacteraeota bacterium]|nr:Asp-tRNA(Asn)/Glu-tRNA(Gln) amidotransferase GatCAB subunit A [Candidatus Eremiobacteraeota bacterium]